MSLNLKEIQPSFIWVLLNPEEVDGPHQGTNFESDRIEDNVADSTDK